MKNINEMRVLLGDTKTDFAKRYGIPFRTIQNWESGVRVPPEYLLQLLEQRVQADAVNHRTASLPEKKNTRKDLPLRSDYIGAIPWLQAVHSVLGKNTVFALDEALMCEERFLGRNEEYLVWIYGNDSLRKYNGVVILGNEITSNDVVVKDGLKYTSFNRTLNDAFANEDLLDMQGITEALNSYYEEHNKSFAGLTPAPQYQDRFKELADDAINYYTY